MKIENDIETSWEHYFDSAVGYYELQMLDEAEAELNKLTPCDSAHSILVLALRLGISYSRCNWSEMKAIARHLFLLDPSNPHWPFSDGYATAKIDSITDAEEDA